MTHVTWIDERKFGREHVPDVDRLIGVWIIAAKVCCSSSGLLTAYASPSHASRTLLPSYAAITG
jgi:hypothetical protein